MKWSFGAAALLALSGCSAGQDKTAAEAGVAQFHRQLQAGDYHEIYRGAAAEFRQSGSENSAVRFLDTVNERLGAVQRANQQNWRVNFTSGGNMVILDYATEFAHGRGVENFVFRVQGGQAKLVGYHINSGDLISMPAAPLSQDSNATR